MMGHRLFDGKMPGRAPPAPAHSLGRTA